MRQRVWIALMCWLVAGGVSPVFAYDVTGALDNAESALDRTLGNLKDSVAKLVEDNKAISAASEELRGRIRVLKNDLASAENERIKKTAQLRTLEAQKQKKVGSGPNWEGQLTQAQRDLASLKEQRARIQEDIDREARDDESVRFKIEGLKQEISDLKDGGIVSMRSSPEMKAFRAERDQLLQEIQDVSARLEKTKEEWQSVSAPAMDQSISQIFDKNPQVGKEEITTLNQEIVGLREAVARQEASSSEFMASENKAQFLSDLEADIVAQEEGVKALQKDLGYLDEKAAGLSKKAADQKSGRSQDIERQYNEAKMRNIQLRADLDRLRFEMIRLDKKKSLIEKDLYRQKY